METTDKEDWKPQSPSATAADVPRLCQLHRLVVFHCWAVWDYHDRRVDVEIQVVRGEVEPEIGIYALNVDDAANFDLLKQASVLNIPALVCFVGGAHGGTSIGTRPAIKIRELLQEWWDASEPEDR